MPIYQNTKKIPNPKRNIILPFFIMIVTSNLFISELLASSLSEENEPSVIIEFIHKSGSFFRGIQNFEINLHNSDEDIIQTLDFLPTRRSITPRIYMRNQISRTLPPARIISLSTWEDTMNLSISIIQSGIPWNRPDEKTYWHQVKNLVFYINESVTSPDRVVISLNLENDPRKEEDIQTINNICNLTKKEKKKRKKFKFIGKRKKSSKRKLDIKIKENDLSTTILEALSTREVS